MLSALGDPMTYRQVPVSYALTWIKCSIKIASTQYALFLAAGLLTTLAPVLVSLVPIVGPIASAFLGFALSFGLLRLTEKVMNRETATFEDFVNMAFDARIYQRFQTYLIIIGVLAVVVALSTVSLKYMSAPLGFVAGIVNWFCVYAAFEEWGTGSADSATTNTPVNKEAFKKAQSRLMFVFHGVMNNFAPLLVLFVLLGLLAFICFILCVAPFLFFYLPMMAPVNFLIFSSLFRGMDMDQELNKWTVIAEGKASL